MRCRRGRGCPRYLPGLREWIAVVTLPTFRMTISMLPFFEGEDEMPNGASPMPGIETSANCPGLCPRSLLSNLNSKKRSVSVKVFVLTIVATSGRYIESSCRPWLSHMVKPPFLSFPRLYRQETRYWERTLSCIVRTPRNRAG